MCTHNIHNMFMIRRNTNTPLENRPRTNEDHDETATFPMVVSVELSLASQVKKKKNNTGRYHTGEND